MYDSCEIETENFPKIGQKVFFSECPDYLWEGVEEPFGKVTEINKEENLVFVQIEAGVIRFDLDGDSWSHCGTFKRDSWSYQGDFESCMAG